VQVGLLLRDHAEATADEGLVDGAGTNALGSVITALFLGGSVLGLVVLGIAVRRARLAPVAAAVLLIALAWIGLAIARTRSQTTLVPPVEVTSA